jgi:hypothetical protein
MPEIWVPYGNVETLLTIQAENLGAVVEPAEASRSYEPEKLAETIRRTGAVFVCDAKPPTVQLLKDVIALLGTGAAPKLYAADPKKVEALAPELKGKLVPLAKQAAGSDGAASYGPDLRAPGAKVFVATAQPDPLFGLVDARVAAASNWIGNSGRICAERVGEFAPSPFAKTAAYDAAEELLAPIPEASFVTVVPRLGRAWSVTEDAPFDIVVNGFFSASATPARALAVGAGGSGYDDTLSGALRLVWGALGCVRKSGEVLIIAECAGGLGSKALEMLVSGRWGEVARRREKYVEGLEEVEYLARLKREYDVMLLSGLPEIYAKSKLGLGAAKGSGEALGRLLGKLGRTSKVNVVTRASECRFVQA